MVAKDANATDADIVDKIRQLFNERGHSLYGGEAVTQLEHALQAAHLAEQAGDDSATIAAALLHDLGHLLHDLDDNAPEQGVDDVHEQLANEWLTNYFLPAVTEPVRLHVAAKRYLCTVDPGYLEGLSEPSLLSLELQGGLLTNDESREFEQHSMFEQIVQVRRYDDQAKVVGLATPDVEHFLRHVEACLSLPKRAEASS